ncbi:hemolysin secretion protein D [Edaphobacter acidisoli]|uniref:Hemolysin secretion protein D n=1 Tax=Edaphobacter acidisoli TaxID=2040573 RepID=A0A916RVN0_9BACT|nr:efflux RND transporter periplasmic adaptor subunit [Edaphobacter acidisoli]GGA69765.1 hemolysin secretion protein D [Edaphobacter acidisoli]
MNARNRILILMGILLVIALVLYFTTTPRNEDLQLIGTVDANEVVLSSRIPGRIQTLTINEGDDVKAGELVATIQSDDLAAARNAAEAAAASQKYKLQGTQDTERQTSGSTTSQVANARAQLQVAEAALLQAQANYEHQQADSNRTIALAQQGVMSQQSSDEARTSLAASKAAVDSAQQSVTAAEASLKLAIANTLQTQAAAKTVASTRSDMQNAQALLDQAQVELDYSKVIAPIDGKINVLAGRVGEVVAAGTPIATITDLTQTWVYAPLPETEADSVQLGDSLRVVMPSGETTYGKVIAKSAEGDFATQRDVSRRKRDIETIRLKLLIANPGMKYVPGMLADVYIPKSKLVHP